MIGSARQNLARGQAHLRSAVVYTTYEFITTAAISYYRSWYELRIQRDAWGALIDVKSYKIAVRPYSWHHGTK